MSRFECEACGELDEYVGCKITIPDEHSLKFTQPVIIQSFEDEFELPKRPTSVLARVGDVLTKSSEEDIYHQRNRPNIGQELVK